MRDSFENAAVKLITPHSAASKAMMNGMDFLNSVASRYPAALSLAAGRPANQFADARDVATLLDRFVEARGRTSQADVWRLIGQYSRTEGIINDLIQTYLARDERAAVDADGIFLTNGFQEALLIHLLDLAAKGGAVVSLDPSYVGLAGAAEIAQVPLFAASGSDAVDALRRGVQAARAAGYRQVAIYVIPDFPNPGGRSLTLPERGQLLDLARELDVLVLEDTAYRVFWYEAEPLPSLLRLDDVGLVRHIGTFSKMFLPGIRVGFSARKGGKDSSLDNHIAIKSFASVATSPVAQAIVGGFLIDCDFEVQRWNSERRAHYKSNRDVMQEALHAAFDRNSEVRWRNPDGGFFITLDVPFEVTTEAFIELAEEFGVLVVPMTMFSPSGGSKRQMRLSFSSIERELIPEAIDALARFIKGRLHTIWRTTAPQVEPSKS